MWHLFGLCTSTISERTRLCPIQFLYRTYLVILMGYAHTCVCAARVFGAFFLSESMQLIQWHISRLNSISFVKRAFEFEFKSFAGSFWTDWVIVISDLRVHAAAAARSRDMIQLSLEIERFRCSLFGRAGGETKRSFFSGENLKIKQSFFSCFFFSVSSFSLWALGLSVTLLRWRRQQKLFSPSST